MDYRKIIEKLEHDLSHYLIDEISKGDPAKRQSADMYKYKGLAITADPRSKVVDKTIKVRIGALEAEFRISNGEKCSGGLTTQEEKLLTIWLSKTENAGLIRRIFNDSMNKRELSIIPFDLEDVFDKTSD